MQLYILRHGIAEDTSRSGRDPDRELTDEGRKKLRDVLKVARQADVKPELVISSPYIRAVGTADIAVEVLGGTPERLQSDTLVPHSDAETVWQEVRQHRAVSQVMLVGHEPLLSRVAAYMLASPSLFVDMKKGALLRIDVDQFGPNPHGVLRWMLVPKLA